MAKANKKGNGAKQEIVVEEQSAEPVETADEVSSNELDSQIETELKVSETPELPKGKKTASALPKNRVTYILRNEDGTPVIPQVIHRLKKRKSRLVIPYTDNEGSPQSMIFEGGSFRVVNFKQAEVLDEYIKHERASHEENDLYNEEDYLAKVSPDKVFFDYKGEQLHKKQATAAIEFAIEHGFEIPEVVTLDGEERTRQV
jgi:hypothetical protein